MHIPVLTNETIENLAPHQNENFIDATCGFGGHAKLILEKTTPDGKLLAIDQDIVALENAKKNLDEFGERVSFAHSNFDNLGLIIREWKVQEVNGVLFDLGVSTYQLTSSERGFSFLPRGKAGNQDSILDMRMSPESQKLSAQEIVNKWAENDLKSILKKYGEEPFAAKIAQAIVFERKKQPIIYTNQLVEVIKKALPPQYRINRQKHFATSTFRTLRMTVNNELKVLESGLKQGLQILSPGGRMVVISFHSLEDRIVKNFFRDNPNLKVVTNKPVIASEEEINNNPKARSAKLRCAIKI
ncbi:MAG: Ribosomal small subunit methyltransferase [Candidatus Berkelbacteria bacterium]|nr:Ribosomal small subunit methyltransferase [Candidatus Berkelbacteria bacterium]